MWAEDGGEGEGDAVTQEDPMCFSVIYSTFIRKPLIILFTGTCFSRSPPRPEYTFYHQLGRGRGKERGDEET